MESELLRGNTPTLVLAALADGPQHGYAIAQEINKRTDNSLRFKPGRCDTVDFYKPYDRDPETYHCPDDDLSRNKDQPCVWFYAYRNSLFLPDRPKMAGNNKIKPAPESVLMYCLQHQVGGPPLSGLYTALRENGAVSVVSVEKTAFWAYHGNQWVQLGGFPSDGSTAYEMFPGEAWPP